MKALRTPGPSVLEVLDRVLDKGIVIDAWMRVSLIGIDLLTVETRVIVASLETYLTHVGKLKSLPIGAPTRLNPSSRARSPRTSRTLP